MGCGLSCRISVCPALFHDVCNFLPDQPYKHYESFHFKIPSPRSDAQDHEFLDMVTSFSSGDWPPITHLQFMDPEKYYGMFGARNPLSSFSSADKLECDEQTIEGINQIPGVEHFSGCLRL